MVNIQKSEKSDRHAQNAGKACDTEKTVAEFQNHKISGQNYLREFVELPSS